MQVNNDKILNEYFSDENVNYIHNVIIKTIKDNINVKISRQSDPSLLNVMIFVYENYIRTTSDIKVLNSHVLKEVIPMIEKNIRSQQYYINYISKPREPIARGISTTSRGKDVFEHTIGY